jgi:hypothetical protein
MEKASPGSSFLVKLAVRSGSATESRRSALISEGCFMTIRMISPRLILRTAAAMIAVVLALAFLPAQSAQALGNNREVSRSCGTNWVASGRYSSTHAWAVTQKLSGDCAGRLSAGLRASDGYTWPRRYGNSGRAEADETDPAGFGTGMHWGCDSCNVTYS